MATTKGKIAEEKDRKGYKGRTLSETMRSVRIHEYGGIDNLKYEEVLIPEPAADEILIKVHAAGVNPSDWKIREGAWKDSIKQKLPLILGWDVAGTVAQKGALINRFNIGDRVIARLDVSRDGAYAEYAIAKADDVAFAPDIPLNMAAGVPLVSQTAWMGLFETGGLRQDQKVLIHGASGGVGTFAVQLAKIAGAYVIGTTSENNIELVKELGADEVIDYQKEDFSEKLNHIDMVFDTIGGETQSRSWKVLKKNGLLVSTLAVDEKAASKYGKTGKTFSANSNGARLQEIAGLINKQMLRVIIDKEFLLEEVKEAHKLSQSGQARGKIILLVS
jgi:NADPH:quinone reductase-like Zn-dependent oxidoreductase